MPASVLTIALLVGGLASAALAGDVFQVTTPGSPGSGDLVPLWTASGVAAPGSVVNTFRLEDALPGGQATVVFGFRELAAPFQGGILGPSPDVLVPHLAVDAAGGLTLRVPLPPDVPVGAELWSQAWVVDPRAASGLASSNTLRLTVRALPDAGLWFPGQSLPTQAGPADMAFADMDADGLLDLVTVDSIYHELLVWTGHGDGSFGAIQVSDDWGEFGPNALAVGDLDGDGLPDVAVSNFSDDSVTLGLSASQPLPHGNTTILPGGDRPNGIAVDDLDLDGDLDIAVSNGDSEGLTVWLGEGDGSFFTPLTQDAGQEPRDVAIADFDMDGIPDVVVANKTVDRLSVRPGLGDGSFGTALLVDVGDAPVYLTVGDVDGDGAPDIVSGNVGDDTVSVVRNLGDGTFAAAEPVAAGDGPQGVAVADFDGDGHADIAVSAFLSDDVTFLAGAGDGTFPASQVLQAASNPERLTATDLDGDGQAELAIAHGTTDDVSVVRGGPGQFPVARGEGVPSPNMIGAIDNMILSTKPRR